MEHQDEKIKQFVDTFRDKTGEQLQYIVRAPGRVNLIGDHIDYHGFAVLPMAIENCIWLGCSFSRTAGCQPAGNPLAKGAIRILNTDNKLYPTFRDQHSFLHGSQLNKSHKWFHYILCGYHGILVNKILEIPSEKIFEYTKSALISEESCRQLDINLNNLAGFTILVDADLPTESGLSSSSALVCASALATCLLLKESQNFNGDYNDGDLNLANTDYEMLAECCSKFEHLIGTHGGGMDQAVILTAQQGYAKFVEFSPKIRCENVALPNNVTWLVSHCGNGYAKAATSGFNSRVLETKLSAAVIAQVCGAKDIKLDHTITLGQVKRELFANLTIGELIAILKEKVFLKDEYTVDEVVAILGITRQQLIDQFSTSEIQLTETIKNKLKLLPRCQHVFEEAERVAKFKSICATVDENDVHILGKLMIESHYSLRDKYECSHPDLDNLVAVALEAGALGARLTGAGWGGCIVSLVETTNSDQVIQRLKQESKFTFPTEPRAGCNIIKIPKDLKEKTSNSTPQMLI